MNPFTVNIYSHDKKAYLTSFTHPLTKLKVRRAFKSKSAATRYQKIIEEQFSRKSHDDYHSLNLEELLVIFVNNRPNSPFVRSKMHLLDFFNTFKTYRVREISSEALMVWLDQVQQENNIQNTSMRGLKCEIDTFFAFLVEQDIISVSPLKEIYYTRNTTKTLSSRNLLTEEEIEKLLKVLNSYSPGYLYPIIKIISETAAKVTELLEITWEQVDLEKKTVSFHRREKIQARVIQISSEMTQHLKSKSRRPALVFETYRKEPFNRYKLMKEVNDFKRTGLTSLKWTPDDLRHSFAVNFLKDGGTFERLQYLLGHVSIQHTRALYRDCLSENVEPITTPFK